jgi:membrane fusion protein, copper/silver efflux system
MSGPAGWWRALSPFARWGAVAAVLAALVVAVFIGVRSGDEPAQTAGSRPASGMAGMEGMSSDGAVRLTAAQIQEFGITFGFAEQRVLTDEVRTVGSVTFDETRVSQVAPKFGGFVERLYVDFTGRPVRRGEPLLEIYSPELVSAQEELLTAQRLQRTLGESSVPGVTGSPDLLSAARRRLLLWDISPAQIDRVLRTGRVQRTMTLYSPTSGVVTEKPVMRGQAVQAGQTLYTIADLSRVWVEAELREADAGLVQIGADATVELSAFPGRPIRGRVEYIYPTVQAEARTLKARVVVANPDGRLRPGMYATVRFADSGRTALTVPTTALVRTGERTLVFADLGSGRLAPQEVEIGPATGDYTEVLSGVEPGQRVVTSAQFLLDSESSLAETMRAMIGMGASGSASEMDMEGMESKGADMKGMPMPPERR